ncbi:EF-hand domain-containing protein [Cupriavidus sp. PET2-C1]
MGNEAISVKNGKMTPAQDRNPIKAPVRPPLLYFSIYCHDKYHSFKKAAETKEREILKSTKWDQSKDIYIAIEVLTEADFLAAWDRIASVANQDGRVIAEGHLFTHASKPGGESSGLEFAAIPGTGDGTIDKAELMRLPVLPWRKTGELVLYGCNTSRTGERREWTPAQIFADRQRVKTTGQPAFSDFSNRPDKYSRISPDSENIYLFPFHRGQNGRFGNGSRYPSQSFEPTP